jgi:hypothetical protein
MTTKIILVVVAVTTVMMLSMMAGQVSTKDVHAAKEKCTTFEFGGGAPSTGSICVEQGKDPTVTEGSCGNFGCVSFEREVTHRQAAEIKTDNQQFCKQVINDNDDDEVTCSTK